MFIRSFNVFFFWIFKTFYILLFSSLFVNLLWLHLTILMIHIPLSLLVYIIMLCVTANQFLFCFSVCCCRELPSFFLFALRDTLCIPSTNLNLCGRLVCFCYVSLCCSCDKLSATLSGLLLWTLRPSHPGSPSSSPSSSSSSPSASSSPPSSPHCTE